MEKRKEPHGSFFDGKIEGLLLPSGLEQGVERIQKRFGVVCCAAFVLHDIFMRGMPQQDIAAGRASRKIFNSMVRAPFLSALGVILFREQAG